MGTQVPIDNFPKRNGAGVEKRKGDDVLYPAQKEREKENSISGGKKSIHLLSEVKYKKERGTSSFGNRGDLPSGEREGTSGRGSPGDRKRKNLFTVISRGGGPPLPRSGRNGRDKTCAGGGGGTGFFSVQRGDRGFPETRKNWGGKKNLTS